MATKTQTIVAPTPPQGRATGARTVPAKRNALAPARGSAKREAAKLSEFREKLSDRKRQPEERTARTSLFGGRRT